MKQMNRLWLWTLDRLSILFMWLALHCECLRFGHDWQLSPDSAWCDRCEDRITGPEARRLYEAKHGPYVVPPETPRKPIVVLVDPDCPPGSVYMLDMSRWEGFRWEGFRYDPLSGSYVRETHARETHAYRDRLWREVDSSLKHGVGV